MSLNLIITSVGKGKRFVKAGYSVYKPFIEINDKAMINHVIELFDRNVNVIIIASESHKEDFKVYAESNRINVIYIKDHKNGPAYSIYEVRELLKLDEAYFVSYNDIVWDWNFSNFLAFTGQKCPDVAVLTHIGFHPHLYKNNFSAFCRLNGSIISAIKEKESFTSDWMNEHLSVGGFYFRKGIDMIYAIEKLLEDDKRVVSEFFPSIAINYLINNGKKTLSYEIENFVHWGVPEQLEDVLRWERIFDSEVLCNDLNICMMLCGTGERLKMLSGINKAGLKINQSQIMFEYVISRLGSKNVTLLINDNVKGITQGKYNEINIGHSTVSQTQSLLLTLKEIKKMKHTLVVSNDCFGKFDPEELKKYNDCDIVLFGFNPSLLQRKQDSAHTYFLTNNEFVSEILIKQKVYSGFGLAGMFYLPDCSILNFLDSFNELQNPSFDHFVKYLLGLGKSVKFTVLEDYVHIGTPEEYQEFIFWQKYYE